MKLIEHPNVMRLYDVWETASDLYVSLGRTPLAVTTDRGAVLDISF